MPNSEADLSPDDDLHERHGHRLRSLFIVATVCATACAAFGLIKLIG